MTLPVQAVTIFDAITYGVDFPTCRVVLEICVLTVLDSLKRYVFLWTQFIVDYFI
jgi:hypothetical protein